LNIKKKYKKIDCLNPILYMSY